MDKRISYYNVVPQTGIEHWEQARAAYGEYCSEDTAFHFDFGSRKEEEFCTFCRERGISLIKKSFVKVTGKSIYDYPFMRLHLKNDRFYTNWHSDQKNMNAVYEYYSQFLDLSQVCDLKLNPDGTSEGGECYSGLRQVRKVVVDSVQSKRFDVMRSYYPLNRIILISRKFKDLIESAGLTGCKILPCLKAGQKYTDEEREIDFESETLDREADFFQLHFTDETNRPAKLGNVLQPGRFGGPCPKCDYWHRHSLRDDGEYRDAFQSIRDLKDMDFQYYIRNNTTNRGLAQINDPEFIISNRA
ncbi:MAG: hypothetical protein GY854_25420, partial [Deltaproteobacteria bacterium]|nr:hypothetical protein [Deltaproteobacteria bacterium]